MNSLLVVALVAERILSERLIDSASFTANKGCYTMTEFHETARERSKKWVFFEAKVRLLQRARRHHISDVGGGKMMKRYLL